MKDIFPTLVGNSNIKEYVGHDILNNINSHAYIIEGPAGSGKHTLATLIASALACINRNDTSHPLPCGVCDNCRKIKNNNSGDVVFVNRGDKASIGVDAVRNIREGLYVMPNDSDYRTYIIEEADKMTVQAQNAFLISLEEPPSFAVFLLLTEDRSKLLETIRSRAQIIRTEFISEEMTKSYLMENDRGRALFRRDPDEFARIVTMSGGVIGKALMLVSDSEESVTFKRCREIAETVISYICKGKKPHALHVYLDAKIQSAAEAKEILLIMADAVRDMILVKKADVTGYRFYGSRDKALVATSDVSLKKLIAVNDGIYEAIGMIESNVSYKNVISGLIFSTSRQRK